MIFSSIPTIMVRCDKIKYVDFPRLRVGEQIEFLGMVGFIVNKFNLNSMNMEKIVESFKKSLQEAESRFKQTRNRKLTRQMIEQDALRDNDIIFLRSYAATMARYFEPEIKKAAELLLKTIDHYGTRIYDMNYEEETAVIRNLVNKMKTKPELVDAIRTLNLKALLANLERNNSVFSDMYMMRVKEKTHNQDKSTTELLKQAFTDYRILIRTLEAKAYLEPSEAFNNSIAEINTIAQRQIDKINQRGANKGRSVEVKLQDEREAEIGLN